MANRMYSEVPEPRFVEAARTVIPDGVADGKPVDFAALTAGTVAVDIVFTGAVLTAPVVSPAPVMVYYDGELPQENTCDIGYIFRKGTEYTVTLPGTWEHDTEVNAHVFFPNDPVFTVKGTDPDTTTEITFTPYGDSAFGAIKS